MTSVDSGVETGNDSNDSSILFNERVQHEGQQQHAANQIVNNNVTTVANFSIDMDNIKWPTQIGLGCRNLESYNCENKGNSLENNLISSSAGKLSLPKPCCHETRDCNQLRWYSIDDTYQLINRPSIDSTYQFINDSYQLINSSYHPLEIVKHKSDHHWGPKLRSHIRARKNMLISWQKSSIQRKMRIAAATNNILLMEQLLRYGESPNCFDDQGRTPLHHAACRGYTEMVRMLLENGADPNQRDCIGNTPLHLAAVTSKISVVTLLLGAGTDVHLLDKYGYNPLQLAQTKLKLFQNYKDGDMVKVKEEMHHVVNMLMVYFQKQEKNTQIEIEMLSNFCSRLSLSNTSDQVQNDVKDLLTNINALSITS